ILNKSRFSKEIKNNRSPYKDHYRGWVAINTNKRNQSSKYKEIPLFESYSFFYITQFLFFLKENGWMEESCQNELRWNNILEFVEANIWTKWYERSQPVKG